MAPPVLLCTSPLWRLTYVHYQKIVGVVCIIVIIITIVTKAYLLVTLVPVCNLYGILLQVYVAVAIFVISDLRIKEVIVKSCQLQFCSVIFLHSFDLPEWNKSCRIYVPLIDSMSSTEGLVGCPVKIIRIF